MFGLPRVFVDIMCWIVFRLVVPDCTCHCNLPEFYVELDNRTVRLVWQISISVSGTLFKLLQGSV